METFHTVLFTLNNPNSIIKSVEKLRIHWNETKVEDCEQEGIILVHRSGKPVADKEEMPSGRGWSNTQA